jgi:hypothetical protein
MAREKLKRGRPRGESTEAEHWDGPTRTSDEGAVMEPEQRVGSGGCIIEATGDRRTR